MSEAPKAATMLPDSTAVRKKRQSSHKKEEDGRDQREKEEIEKCQAEERQSKVFVKSQEEERSKDSQRKEGEEYSDLDLTKPFHSIGHYIFDREEMLQQAFQSVSKEQIDTMMPDVLKTCPMEVIKALCLGQLEGMSKKRIFHVLAGEEMLSSSDTDESGNEDEPKVQEEKPQEEEVVPQEEQGDEQMEAVVPNIQETVVPHTTRSMRSV
ncbi:hypothetical protein BSL78_09615 [Apostichopus japonicus]|uniref:Uncharacterized protein n=1 Tax=Stichopus japonicus TaxID=307972 RepID=A0A2G8KZT7_STIJA|nr:hypothetical protein BSL78_09615 [Apostichopus japonicus]